MTGVGPQAIPQAGSKRRPSDDSRRRGRMASNRLTDFVIPSGDSKYAGLTAQQAADRFLGRHRLILVSAVAVVVVLLVACFASAGPNVEHPEVLALYLITYFIVIFAGALLNARNFYGFTGILNAAFDP